MSRCVDCGAVAIDGRKRCADCLGKQALKAKQRRKLAAREPVARLANGDPCEVWHQAHYSHAGQWQRVRFAGWSKDPVLGSRAWVQRGNAAAFPVSPKALRGVSLREKLEFYRVDVAEYAAAYLVGGDK